MTSNATFPNRLTKVDDLTRLDHAYLAVDDDCYFVGEYLARQGYSYSPTNGLILNFKKSVDRRHRPEWRYKLRAIRDVATAFRSALHPDDLDLLTFVPIPPSKAIGDPLYDDRLIRMLHSIRPNPRLDIRELIIQTRSTMAAHGSDVRPRPEGIKAHYRIDEAVTVPTPRFVAIVDDVLTTGAHFRAAKSVLSTRFQSVRIVGLFVARRAPGMADIEG